MTEQPRYDLIGDVHGCIDELRALLELLGHDPNPNAPRDPNAPEIIFLGDLVDRGPASLDCLRLAMRFVGRRRARCVMGNHDDKLRRYLKGNPVVIAKGLQTTVAELDRHNDPLEREHFYNFLETIPDHLLLDNGTLFAVHAAYHPDLHAMSDEQRRHVCLYGPTSGEDDDLGIPLRDDWAPFHRGNPLVAYGHTPQREPRAINNTYNLDTGCVYGNKLSALRYPAMQLVSTPALDAYSTKKPHLRNDPPEDE